MAFNNRNNLSNESAPWGREVEQKIESNTYNLNQLRLLTENNNKATNGTLSALTRQQQVLTEQQTQLQTTQQVLEAQQIRLNERSSFVSSDQTVPTNATPAWAAPIELVAPSWATSVLLTIIPVVNLNISATGGTQHADVFTGPSNNPSSLVSQINVWAGSLQGGGSGNALVSLSAAGASAYIRLWGWKEEPSTGNLQIKTSVVAQWF